MKVLLFNGSTRKNGSGFRALTEVATTLEQEGIETEIIQLGALAVHDCTGCGYCHRDGNGHCVFKDDSVNEWLDKAAAADGFIFSSPVYYAHPSGQLLSVLDRMFFANGDCFRFKPGAAVRPRRSTSSTSISPSTQCPLCPRPTGTWRTATSPPRSSRMPRACRPCATSRATWRGCSRASTPAARQVLPHPHSSRKIGRISFDNPAESIYERCLT